MNDIQYLEHNKNKNQSECLFLLFEVHITLGFNSEVSAFILIIAGLFYLSLSQYNYWSANILIAQ